MSWILTNSNDAMNIIVGREPLIGDPNVVRVLFSHALPMRVAISDWVDLGLKLGLEISTELYDALAQCDRLVGGEQLAIRYLTGRVRTSTQVRAYLERKEIEPDVIDAVIRRLTQIHVIDDVQYATLYVEQQGTKLGRRALAQKLRQRGIERQVIDDVLSASLSAKQEMETAEIAARKYVERRGYPETLAERAKLMQHLARKGYSISMVRSVAKRIQDDDNSL